MNLAFHGDSYDLVKRFFCAELRVLGYRVTIDPMLTDSAHGDISAFYRLVGASPVGDGSAADGESALFLDPDTGVRDRKSKKHVSFERIAAETLKHSLVFCFDQSFSRSSLAGDAMKRKLDVLATMGCCGMFYDSHARFLFAASEEARLDGLCSHLVQLGLPVDRLVRRTPNKSLETNRR